MAAMTASTLAFPNPRGLNVLDVVLSDADVSSREAVFDAVADAVGCHQGAIRAALRDREAIGSTAVIPGLALPHGAVEGLEQPILVDIALEQALRWAANHDPVNRCLCLLFPAGDEDAHLALLAEAARRAGAPVEGK